MSIHCQVSCVCHVLQPFVRDSSDKRSPLAERDRKRQRVNGYEGPGRRQRAAASGDQGETDSRTGGEEEVARLSRERQGKAEGGRQGQGAGKR